VRLPRSQAQALALDRLQPIIGFEATALMASAPAIQASCQGVELKKPKYVQIFISAAATKDAATKAFKFCD
jgi:hypothetical protein